jgi:ABC-type bacteriocin/lantibiotic exporter with double-glycine peptidase domain
VRCKCVNSKGTHTSCSVDCSDSKNIKAYRNAGQVVSEAVQAIRTVASLTAEQKFNQRYQDLIKEPFRNNIRASLYSGLNFGLSQGLVFFTYGAGFYAGSRFVYNGDYNFLQMNTVMMSIIFTAMGAGQVPWLIAKFTLDFNVCSGRC